MHSINAVRTDFKKKKINAKFPFEVVGLLIIDDDLVFLNEQTPNCIVTNLTCTTAFKCLFSLEGISASHSMCQR